MNRLSFFLYRLVSHLLLCSLIPLYISTIVSRCISFVSISLPDVGRVSAGLVTEHTDELRHPLLVQSQHTNFNFSPNSTGTVEDQCFTGQKVNALLVRAPMV